TAERVRRGVGADRRAEIQVLDPPELSAERDGLLLHAPARPQRREMVAPRQVRRSVRLLVFRRRAARVLGNGRRRAAPGEEALSLYEQPLLGEVGRQRGDDQAAARRADRGRISSRVRRALPRTGRCGEGRSTDGYGFTDIFLTTSPATMRSVTSAPATVGGGQGF